MVYDVFQGYFDGVGVRVRMAIQVCVRGGGVPVKKVSESLLVLYCTYIHAFGYLHTEKNPPGGKITT